MIRISRRNIETGAHAKAVLYFLPLRREGLMDESGVMVQKKPAKHFSRSPDVEILPGTVRTVLNLFPIIVVAYSNSPTIRLARFQ